MAVSGFLDSHSIILLSSFTFSLRRSLCPNPLGNKWLSQAPHRRLPFARSSTTWTEGQNCAGTSTHCPHRSRAENDEWNRLENRKALLALNFRFGANQALCHRTAMLGVYLADWVLSLEVKFRVQSRCRVANNRSTPPASASPATIRGTGLVLCGWNSRNMSRIGST